MHVAVRDVAVAETVAPGSAAATAPATVRGQPHPLGGRDGHVELDRDAEKAGRLRKAFPVGPQPLPVGRGLRHRGRAVADEAAEVVERARPGRLQQQVGRGPARPRRRGRPQARVLDQEVQARPG